MKYLLSSVAIVAALAIASPVSAQGYGPGPGARTGTGPGVTPPGGLGPSSPMSNLPGQGHRGTRHRHRERIILQRGWPPGWPRGWLQGQRRHQQRRRRTGMPVTMAT